jgi:virginiamycin B lyase
MVATARRHTHHSSNTRHKLNRTSGPDGALWFTEEDGQLGRINLSGAITQLALPDPASGPIGLSYGPGHSLWFTEAAGNKISRVSLG